MMNRPSGEARVAIEVSRMEFFEETMRPVDVVAVWSRADQLQADPEVGNPVGVAAKLRRILFGSKVAAASPAFVADAPVLHAERLGKSRCGAHVCQRCASSGRV